MTKIFGRWSKRSWIGLKSASSWKEPVDFAKSDSRRRDPIQGKSGAVRVCYALFPEFGLVFLVLVFGKGDKANLDAAEKIAIKRLLTQYEAALRKRRRRP